MQSHFETPWRQERLHHDSLRCTCCPIRRLPLSDLQLRGHLPSAYALKELIHKLRYANSRQPCAAADAISLSGGGSRSQGSHPFACISNSDGMQPAQAPARNDWPIKIAFGTATPNDAPKSRQAGRAEQIGVHLSRSFSPRARGVARLCESPSSARWKTPFSEYLHTSSFRVESGIRSMAELLRFTPRCGDSGRTVAYEGLLVQEQHYS
jgi:hypothetical protein